MRLPPAGAYSTAERAGGGAGLHSSIGYVLQSPHMFPAPILDNLTTANPNVRMKQIDEALACLRRSGRGELDRLSSGGEAATCSRTGEKQRDFLLPALLGIPNSVLDEATSSIDT